MKREVEPTVWDIANPRRLMSRVASGEIPPDATRTKLGGLTFYVSRGASMPPSEETYKHALTLGKGIKRLLADQSTQTPIWIADVGTGSGIIAITIGKELQEEMKGANPKVRVIGTDTSLEALRDARTNAKQNHISGIEFVQASTLEAFRYGEQSQGIDVVISNPPFMDLSMLEKNLAYPKGFIAQDAVIAGPTGMEMYRMLFSQATQVLSPRGVIIVQHQDYAKENVRRLLIEHMGSATNIRELYGNRQTALIAGSQPWVDMLAPIV